MYVGAVLKNIREEQGFSLLEIQRKTGIKESQLCRIESGSRFPTDEQIFILARFYNIDSNQLQIQRDSDKVLENIKEFSNQEQILDVAKQKLESPTSPQSNELWCSHKVSQSGYTPFFFDSRSVGVCNSPHESNGNYLSVAADSLPGATIPLESRRYIGCKQKLVDWIFDIIQSETENIHTATDIFAGTGVVGKKCFLFMTK